MALPYGLFVLFFNEIFMGFSDLKLLAYYSFSSPLLQG